MSAPRVGIVTTDWPGILDGRGYAVPGGANYVRLQQWRPHVSFLTVCGGLVHHPLKGLGVADEFGKVHHDLDVLIMQRFMFKDVKYLLRQIGKKGTGPVIINDLDDWYWGLHRNNEAWATCQPSLNPDENIDHYAEILRISDVVTVSTPFLEEQMRDWLGHDHVVRIENRIDVDSFAVRRHRARRPIVGWVGSTAHRSNDLEEIAGVIPAGYRVHHSGARPGAPSFVKALDIPEHKVTTLPGMPPRDYARQAFAFDIGLAPLSDIPFNWSKSWVKLTEYAAAGVPFIASPRPEYLRLHEEYGIGRIAHTKAEWIAHIHDLSDCHVRAEEANRQHRAVYALDVHCMAEDWEKVIQSVL